MIPARSMLALLMIMLTCGIVYSQSGDTLLGIRMRPEVRLIVKEIETRTGEPIYAEFREMPEFQFGSSGVDDQRGFAFLLIDPGLRNDAKKLEAVIVHELLHLKLRVNNYPAFIFSPSVQTARGRAIDVEQEHVNELASIIEHYVFKADMERFGVYEYIDLAGDTANGAKARRGDVDGQSDSINYARAILEYKNPVDVATVKQLFQANGWTRALADGSNIARLIEEKDPRTANDVQAVFLACLKTLYPVPKPNVAFQLTDDPTNRYFRRMEIHLRRAPSGSTTRKGSKTR